MSNYFHKDYYRAACSGRFDFAQRPLSRSLSEAEGSAVSGQRPASSVQRPASSVQRPNPISPSFRLSRKISYPIEFPPSVADKSAWAGFVLLAKI